MQSTLLLPTMLMAAANWLAVYNRWKRLEYVTKPGTMLALLAWLWAVSGFQGQLFWFALGIILSLAGDVFLMLPAQSLLAGILAFLLAHLAYIIGFNPAWPPLNAASLIVAALVGITALRVYRRIAAGLTASGTNQLRIPVLAYTVTISLMLFSALLALVKPEWQAGPALLVSGGALLFFVSDTLLAWNEFIERLPNGSVFVMLTYHLGQVGVIVGAALHYLG
jgi:alkenylglycerophosphocholine hydrolase